MQGEEGGPGTSEDAGQRTTYGKGEGGGRSHSVPSSGMTNTPSGARRRNAAKRVRRQMGGGRQVEGRADAGKAGCEFAGLGWTTRDDLPKPGSGEGQGRARASVPVFPRGCGGSKSYRRSKVGIGWGLGGGPMAGRGVKWLPTGRVRQ